MFINNTWYWITLFITAYKAQFTAFIDKNNDGRATFHEIKSYLKKYDHDVTDERVKAFLDRRDSNGNIILYKSDIVWNRNIENNTQWRPLSEIYGNR